MFVERHARIALRGRAGKTHTMQGCDERLGRGIIPRAVDKVREGAQHCTARAVAAQASYATCRHRAALHSMIVRVLHVWPHDRKPHFSAASRFCRTCILLPLPLPLQILAAAGRLRDEQEWEYTMEASFIEASPPRHDVISIRTAACSGCAGRHARAARVRFAKPPIQPAKLCPTWRMPLSAGVQQQPAGPAGGAVGSIHC